MGRKLKTFREYDSRSMSRVLKSRFIVINGSCKNLGKAVRNRFGVRIPNMLVNVSEEDLYYLKKFPETRSYYLYNKSQLHGKCIQDVDCPNPSLYDDFIQVEE